MRAADGAAEQARWGVSRVGPDYALFILGETNIVNGLLKPLETSARTRVNMVQKVGSRMTVACADGHERAEREQVSRCRLRDCRRTRGACVPREGVGLT